MHFANLGPFRPLVCRSDKDDKIRSTDRGPVRAVLRSNQNSFEVPTLDTKLTLVLESKYTAY